MIVYRAQQQEERASACLGAIGDLFRRFEQGRCVAHELAVELLIDYGRFEAATADLLSTDANTVHPIVTLLRQAATLTGHLLYHCWQGSADSSGLYARRFQEALEQIAAVPLPQTLHMRVPEGYAYYGLYPETYLEAANAFWHEHQSREVTCIGIRSIGTSLSAMVAATLEECGCSVHSYTVRCQGHPFDRRLVLALELEERWRASGHGHFLIVDEGPGLSGSSLCSVAQKLADLGIPDDRIVFLPSRSTDGTDLVSATARRRWPRHRQYLVSFADLWIKSGCMARWLPGGRITDVSAGQWRPLFFPQEAQYPAVQPWHERRKYLCVMEPAPTLLLKFAGLGRYGQSIHARARALAEAGFHPPVVGLAHGFLVMEFVHGRAMTQEHLDASFLDRVVQYLAHLSRLPAVGTPMPHEEVIQMIEGNVAEGLGQSWAHTFAHARFPHATQDVLSGATDGRMMLHEWLHLDSRYLKTDAVDHAVDHFSPGCQDPAWDMAGCLMEWGLDRPRQNYLLGQYRAATGDSTLPQRLPFYTIAYLAHRLGYATLAAQTLGPQSPDGRRFQTLAAHYNRLLQRELSQL
ncbi:MAG: hypothetical protein M1376_20015 [Planctomycetes bacterium]|nr:hypothetical protein [Planctomycetota bacterium]